MKKPRKKPKPELRVKIGEDVMRALNLAVARGRFKTAEVVEGALVSYAMIKREMEGI